MPDKVIVDSSQRYFKEGRMVIVKPKCMFCEGDGHVVRHRNKVPIWKCNRCQRSVEVVYK